MKKELHPKTNTIKSTCTTCNKEFTFNSVNKEIKVDVCSNCHPIYTGKSNTASKAGRIERFNKKISKSK